MMLIVRRGGATGRHAGQWPDAGSGGVLGRFDVIIIDTPPLGAGIDPFVLATATGSLALIMRAGETDRQLAEAKLQC
jgi:hypothetical protein